MKMLNIIDPRGSETLQVFPVLFCGDVEFIMHFELETCGNFHMYRQQDEPHCGDTRQLYWQEDF